MANTLLLQFPTLPANAPTDGTTGILLYSGFFVLFAAVSIMLLLKWLRPSASEKLKYRQNDESEAIADLRLRVKQNDEKIEKMSAEMATLREEKQNERDERHDMRSQIQIMLMGYEVCYGLMMEIKGEWKEMPLHLVKRLDAMKKPSDIFTRGK